MNASTPTHSRRFSTHYLMVPGLYVATVLLTATFSRGTPGGAYYRIFGICPPVASLGMVVENEIVLVGAFLIVGTPWWYLVSRIVWDGHERRRGILSAMSGAVVALFTFLVSAGMTRDPLQQDIREGALSGAAITQYTLVALLCLAALLGTIFAGIAALTSSGEQ